MSPFTGPHFRTPSLAALVAILLASGPVASPSGAFTEPFDGAAPLPPPLETASTGGVAAVDRALARLAAHRRLLVIGAHPDDEDNALLTWVSLSGGDAAYLSLSRGEGGQNLLGPELGLPLGLLRTGELLAARRIDGARQFFARAFDFGYTRSLDEASLRWPREALLEDAVRVVRRFQPQVIVAIFPPDERAGHGQHQMSAVIAEAAFAAAGLPDRYPDLTAAGLPPWTPSAFYRRAWNRDEVTHWFSLTAMDPFSGRSMAQVAADSRSHHLSQDMGREQPLGGGLGGLVAIRGAGVASAAEAAPDPFAGVDTRLAALAALLEVDEGRERLEARLDCIERLAVSLRGRLAAVDLDAAVPDLAVLAHALDGALAYLEAARNSAAEPERLASVISLLREKRAAVGAALLAAAGVAVDAVVDRETLAAYQTGQGDGQAGGKAGRQAGAGTAMATLSVWNGGRRAIHLSRVSLAGSPGWQVRARPSEGSEPSAAAPLLDVAYLPAEGDWGASAAADAATAADSVVPPSALRHVALEVRIGESAPVTVPYFLYPGAGLQSGVDLYDWSAIPESVRGEPFSPPPLVASFELEIADVPLEIAREVVFRIGDQGVGEIRRPVRAVPGVEVTVEPGLVILPLAAAERRQVEVRLRSNLDRPVSGHLVAGGGLASAAGEEGRAFQLEPQGGWSTYLSIGRPLGAGAGVVSGEIAAVLDSGERFATAAPVVDYPHTRPVAREESSALSLHLLDLRFPALTRLGFVVGASEALPEELESVGLPVERLDARRLAGDLSGYDAIVVGSRAYETDPQLARVNGRLLEYARSGGLLIVLYQQYGFVRGGLAPFPLDIARPHGRVTDETSPVRLLVPEHRLFHSPNSIGPADWEGWVQERGLYFAASWDEAYMPLLALGDPGQPEERGGLLIAPLGSGTYVYTGLAFFRQLPAGVPGAWRLFANLLALAE